MRRPHSHFHVLATLAFVLTCFSVEMTSAFPVSPLNGDIISHSDTPSSANASKYVAPIGAAETDARANHRREELAPAPIMQVGRFHYDEPDKTGKLNNEDVTLQPIGAAADTKRPTQLRARRYNVRNSNNVTLGILKHVNLNKVDKDAVAAIRSEGKLLKKLDHNMFMWEREVDNVKNGIWSYAVMYRAIQGQAYMGGGTSTEPPKAMTLKTLGEWQKEEGWDARIMLPVCERTALSKHKQLASNGIAIDDYSLLRWVSDREGKHWYPLNADPAYEYGPFLHKGYHRGARFLSGSEKKKYKANLPAALAPYFRPGKGNTE